MPNVVEFLEAAGRSAHLRYATAEQLLQFMSDAGVEPSVQATLLSGDARQLETLLGQPANVCCLIYAPQDDEPGEGEEPAKEQDEK